MKVSSQPASHSSCAKQSLRSMEASDSIDQDHSWHSEHSARSFKKCLIFESKQS